MTYLNNDPFQFYSKPTINPIEPSNIVVYRRLIENVPSGIYMANIHDHIIYANHALAEMLCETTNQNLLGVNLYSQLIHDKDTLETFIKKLHSGIKISNEEVCFLTLDGRKIFFLLSCHCLHNDRGDFAGSEGFLIDITQRRLLSDELLSEKHKLEALLNFNEQINSIHSFTELIQFVIDETSKLLDARRCSIMILDEKTNELRIEGSVGIDEEFIELTRIKMGEGVSGIVAKDGQPLLVKNIEYELPFRRASRSSYKSRSFIIVPIKFEGKIIGTINVADKNFSIKEHPFNEIDLKILCAIAREVAIAIENVKMIQELNLMTVTDPLTHIYNYRQFVQSLDYQIKRMEREKNGNLCIIMMDVDKFKTYNDTFGHLEGDALLSGVGKILKEQLRETDIICRYAGDEFVIVLPDTDEIGAQKASIKIKTAVSTYPFKRQVTISLGVAKYQHGLTQKEIIRRADTALYYSKHGGRDQVCVFSENMEMHSEK